MKKFIYYLFTNFLIIVVIGINVAYSQVRTVEGKVSSQEEGVLPGVNVVVKGTSIGTVTDGQGSYKLNVPSDESILVFTFIGYENEEVRVGSRSTIDVVLNTSSTALEEVVVVGYGSVKRSDLTGSVASVGADQLKRTINSSFEQGLKGRVAGVKIVSNEGAPGAGFEINIRGMTSLNADNSPLYVVDGFPLSGSSEGAFLGSSMTRVSPLGSLNPNDIESIEILKDASATAIYGSRGANGVVLITTKKGRPGVSNISYNTYYGVSTPPKRIGVLNAQQYIDRIGEWGADGILNDSFYQRDENNDYVLDGEGNRILINVDEWPQYDWQDIIFQNSIVQDHQISYTHGTDNSTTTASLGYFSQEGIVIESKYKRFSGNINQNFKLNNKLQTGGNFNFAYSENKGIVGASGYGTKDAVLVNTVFFRPIFGYSTTGGVPLDADRRGNIANPQLTARETDMTRRDISLRGNYYIDYQILPGLSFRSSIGATASTAKQELWNPPNYNPGQQVNGITTHRQDLRLNWLFENILNYKKSFGEKHNLNTTVGYTMQMDNREDFSVSKQDFTLPTVNLDNIGNGLEYRSAGSGRSSWSIMSYLARVNYSFNNRYLLTFSGRADGSSKFPDGKKWGFFPSGAIAWRFSEEGFIRPLNIISDGKIRVSYGISGNQGISPYSSLAKYNVSKYPFSSNLSTGLSSGVKPTSLSAIELTWETTNQLDIGLDFGIFNNRIKLVVDYYRKLTSNLLMDAPLPAYLGFTSSYINAGEVENKGWEFSVNLLNVSTSNFSWVTNFNISFNRNKVISLAEGDFFNISPQGRFNSGYRIEVGRPIGTLYGYEFDGVYQYSDFVEFDGLTLDESAALWETKNSPYTLKEGVAPFTGQENRIKPGYMKLKDVNGDGVVDSDDQTYLGVAQPKHFGGISNELTYKNFSISSLFEWVYGNKVLNGFLKEGTQGNPFTSQFAFSWDERWQPTKQSNTMWYTNYIYGAKDMNSFFIQDGSFIRFSNITMSYDFNEGILNNLNIEKIRVYVSGDNIYSWNNYSGFDPEVSNSGGLTPGTDYGSYPKARSYRIGLNLTF